MDRKFILSALGYALVGIALGIYMGATNNHGQFVTHAHIMMVGFLLSFIYGLCHKIWLGSSKLKLAKVQFYIHQVGSLVLLTCLFLLYGNFVAAENLDPFLGVSSVAVFIGVVLISVQVVQTTKPCDSSSS